MIGLMRMFLVFQEYIDYVYVVMICCVVDLNDLKRGLVNVIILSVIVLFYYGFDVQMVILINIEMMVFVVFIIFMYVYSVMIEFKKLIMREDVIDIFENIIRVFFFEKERGFESMVQFIEFVRDFYCEWNNFYEIVVWKESISVKGNRFFYIQVVYQESDVVLENVDVIRVMFEMVDKWESIRKMNKSFGILK